MKIQKMTSYANAYGQPIHAHGFYVRFSAFFLVNFLQIQEMLKSQRPKKAILFLNMINVKQFFCQAL